MKRSFFTILCMLGSWQAFAQQQPAPPPGTDTAVITVLLTVIIGLGVAIAVLGSVVISAMDIYRERMKREAGKAVMIAAVLLGGMLSARNAIAQETAQQAVRTISGMAPTTFYLVVSVIVLEIIIIISLLFMLRVLVGIERKPRPKKAGKPRVNWLEKLNRTKSLDAVSEAEADMGHDFDGIRELNNPTPPWWKWGFYFSIAFAVVYLWRFQVAHSAPSQLEELAMAEEKATAAREEYLKNAANNIDENSVTLLTDAGDLAAGQKLFTASCSPCHGPQGQGVVGPNLTDDYWLHGGKVNDIFRTIKYGVPEKGMKSWKDDFSPKQLAQLASFIKSIHGSNPSNPKEKQGELYSEK